MKSLHNFLIKQHIKKEDQFNGDDLFNSRPEKPLKIKNVLVYNANAHGFDSAYKDKFIEQIYKILSDCEYKTIYSIAINGNKMFLRNFDDELMFIIARSGGESRYYTSAYSPISYNKMIEILKRK